MKNQTHKPFFSIVIPTYNRAKDLRVALAIIVKQTFRDFEVIVSDNCSTDETKSITVSFRDKRIIYRCNRINIGWIGNLREAINAAHGIYIILQGDDDKLINSLALARIYRNITKYKFPGYIRINYLCKFENENVIFDFDLSKKYIQTQKIEPEQAPENIVTYIESSDPYFVTGICFKKENQLNKQIINSEFIPWFKIIYEMTYKYGGLYISEYLFISKWLKKMRKPGHPFFYLKNGKFTFELYFLEVEKKVSQTWYNAFMHRHVMNIVHNFPANKLSTNNTNLLRCARRLLAIAPSEGWSIEYWVYFCVSILAPHWILNIVKKLVLEYYVVKFRIRNRRYE